ncbi:hypothetical protein AYK26_06925 [Euryarchaeota archaeon SM23-78]|nr:MAG: hypothetical protein AYK26_06925 [Euryarchaeota archaeon SM23-78]
MVNKKLQEMGNDLNVSKEDIQNIQKTSFKEKLISFFVHPALRAVLAILTFILGISLGGGCINCDGYPFAAAVGTNIIKSRKKSIIYSILIPVITFIAGYLVGMIFFGYAIKYNVYKR